MLRSSSDFFLIPSVQSIDNEYVELNGRKRFGSWTKKKKKKKRIIPAQLSRWDGNKKDALFDLLTAIFSKRNYYIHSKG